ncbi:uncharacterized protein LOC130899946 [Diorhabda carinulata]|uniref:uncharacterized protein LOC130899946 n=1 Tax=Diorhabda carinulata TaxID=1163345 RepID=UPI0025A1E615|nr:uncharacterized protein LOC130899946 [Diorhabda carinulata]
MGTVKNVPNKKVLLTYELNSKQDALVNYLVPSVCACILYMFLIAADIAVIFSHYKNGDPIWASLTLFILYIPVLASFIIIISNWELWPEFESCSKVNLIWFWTKVLEHLLFPVWSMWRFAERIFWSIEAVRAADERSTKDAVSVITSPRSIELYIFLQSYLHALPQVLLQLYILIRHNNDLNRQTEKAQILSLVLNLVKVSVTTTYYQRFKSQKLTGKQYPWYKQHVANVQASNVVLRRHFVPQSRNEEERLTNSQLVNEHDSDPPRYSRLSRRRSSDFYLEPTTSGLYHRHTLLETDFDENVQTKIKILDEGLDEVDGPPQYTSGSYAVPIIDDSNRIVSSQSLVSDYTEPDFNISRVINVKGLEDDDLAGKLIAIVWWFTFLLARVLTISIFAYFYMKETIYVLTIHFILIVVILVYDVKSDAVKRSKSVFFLFIGLVYIFCIIEFKIKFKKATLIFYGFFVVVFIENIIMCLLWYLLRVDSIENDFWFRYVFYVIISCLILSFSTMVFYFILNKPQKVTIETIVKK